MTMKTFSAFLVYFAFIQTAYAHSCEEMLGTYRVIPFIEPAGLTLTSEELVSHSPIGTPIFKVVNNNGSTQHIGLIKQSIHLIHLEPTSRNNRTDADILFESPVSSCSYELDKDVTIVQVDLTHLTQQQSEQALNYIRRTWGSDFPDIQEDRNKLIKNNHDIQYYNLDHQSLRMIKYVLISRATEIGVGGMAFIIPLQKTNDKAKLTPIQSPLSHK